MELILIRHAEAESMEGYVDDAQRPLTANGEKTQKVVGRALRKLALVPDVVLTSSRLRARQTAEISLKQLDAKLEVQTTEVLSGGYSTHQFIQILQPFGGDLRVMCFGHEPDLSIWAGELLCGSLPTRVEFKKSAVLGLGFDDVARENSARLLFFYRARDLKRLL